MVSAAVVTFNVAAMVGLGCAALLETEADTLLIVTEPLANISELVVEFPWDEVL